jgi:hypothetical protein
MESTGNLDTNIPAKSIYDCIVLDLDGTLVYSSKKDKGQGEKIVFKDMHSDDMELFVHKRPGFEKFIRKCFETTTVGVFSMGQAGYVEAVVSLFPQRPAFVYNWCDCDRAKGKIFKRLNSIPHQGKIIMIDDKLDILEICERVETRIVPEWNIKDQGDTVLYDLISQLFINDF